MANDFKSFFADVFVCKDVPSHFAWFQENYNCNREDYCNLRRESE